MMPANALSRITIDISREAHKRLKAMAALYGKTMREMIIEAIEKHIHCNKTVNKFPTKEINAELDKAVGAALDTYTLACKKLTK